MKKGLSVMVFFVPEDVCRLRDLGLGDDHGIRDNETREVIFFRIEAISPYRQDGEEFGVVHANGDEYVTTLSFVDLTKLIRNSLTEGILN